jgi:peptidoglycan/LPS O-acetylase OafA/YrhL
MRPVLALSTPVPVYRRDIDGLRATAVLAVLLFHAFPTLLPGGFVGVDIFFVISGYLITGILLRNLARGDLQLFDFYQHRVRRIFPALICVLAACMAAGWLVLFAGEYAQLGRHVTASAVFASNFSLLNESGYFDVAAETKPLLHLWSLAVEEQFYVLWPPLLWLAWKLRVAPLGLAACCVVASFGICLWLAAHDQAADFFSPAARFWEILVGAVLTSIEITRRRPPSKIARTGLSLAGGMVLAASLTLLHGSDPYPGWRAAIPVVGATLVMAAGPEGLVNRRLLAARPLVWIGLISYPLYLWHWPLLAFARILCGLQPSAETRVALLVTSFVLAALTYLTVERPLRFGRRGTAKMAALCIGLLLIGSFGLDDWHRDGLDFRYIAKHMPVTGKAAVGSGNPFVADCVRQPGQTWQGYCETDTREPPRYAVWGDSHGEALFWGLVRMSQPGRRWLLVGRPHCSPMAGIERVTHEGRPNFASNDPALCANVNAGVLRLLLRTASVKVVLIATAWRVLGGEGYAAHATDKPAPGGALAGMSAAVSRLEQAGKQVVFLHDNPAVGEAADCIERHTGFTALDALLPRRLGVKCGVPYDSYISSMAPYRQFIGSLHAAHPAMMVFDPTPLLCDPTANRCPISQNGSFLYSYGDHVSGYGSQRIAADLLPLIDNLAGPM